MIEERNSGRDARGRWKKGHCPNPKGRPRKRPEISEADVYFFKSQLIKATINGAEQNVTRHSLLLHKMYDQALKGSVLMQRKLFDRFEASDELYAKAALELRELGDKVLKRYYETGEYDEKEITKYTEFAAAMGKDLDRPRREARKRRAKKSA